MTAYPTRWSTTPDKDRIQQHYQPPKPTLHHPTKATLPWRMRTPKTLETNRSHDELTCWVCRSRPC